MPSNEPLLKISNVCKEFPVKKNTLYAVTDANLTLDRGETLGLVGESGCGKSTLAKMVAGSLPITSGSITLDGVDYTKLPKKEFALFRRNIQMVFHIYNSSLSFLSSVEIR